MSRDTDVHNLRVRLGHAARQRDWQQLGEGWRTQVDHAGRGPTSIHHKVGAATNPTQVSWLHALSLHFE